MAPTSSASASSTGGGVPTLDYALWAGPHATEQTRAQFARALGDVSVLGLGFFVLANSPLDAGARRAHLFDLTRRFFALPFAQRQALSMDNSRHFRGYAQFGDERTLGRQDLRDQLECGEERAPFPGLDSLSPSQLAAQPYLHLPGPNQFPAEDVLPTHRASATEWFQLGRELNLELTRALELALALPAGTLLRILGDSPADRAAQADAEREFADKAARGDGEEARYGGPLPYFRMKSIRYPRAPTVDGIAKADAASTQGVGAHKDGGWITLLATDAVGGLQVQDFEGAWVDVPASREGIIVNFGQQIEKYTRGAIQAATHRVVLPADAQGLPDRYSIAWFSTPSLTTHVHALPLGALSPTLLDAWRKSGRADAPPAEPAPSLPAATVPAAPGSEPAPNGHANGSAAAAATAAPPPSAGAPPDKPVSKGIAAGPSPGPALRSDVPAGDLHGADGEEFGLLAWRGITRSHPTVVRRWHAHLVHGPPQ